MGIDWLATAEKFANSAMKSTNAFSKTSIGVLAIAAALIAIAEELQELRAVVTYYRK